MSRKYALVTAAVITAVALSACSPTEPKPWPTAEAAVAAPTSATVRPVWVTAPWTGKVNANKAGDQYGATPVPGITIAQKQGEASPYRCTIGPAVRSADHGPAFLTAGHCDKTSNSPLFVYPSPDISGADALQLPGVYTRSDAHDTPDIGTGLVSDSALVPVTSVARPATKIADKYAIAGVLTTAAVKQLPAGTPVCFDGARSGVQCGQLTAANDAGVVRFDADGRIGDSGGPVFLLDQQNRAVLIGIVKGGLEDGSDTSASYLEPALMRLGAAVELDPTVEPFTGNDFSDRISEAQ
ncbi:hypothetical protein BKG79_22410 [Mycobacteroides chelonae]|uniref:hypothetical protein n=1 Tax=Mycobacteroides chelonae TaxID=1774 RepID=UPI0008A8C182|nr:hypothetical protein [Mycobacteroides chelonae]OHU33358.1 hypothetical protein BKG79_22410 [Mycobacteroides chelonae]